MTEKIKEDEDKEQKVQDEEKGCDDCSKIKM